MSLQINKLTNKTLRNKLICKKLPLQFVIAVFLMLPKSTKKRESEMLRLSELKYDDELKYEFLQTYSEKYALKQ